MRTRVINRLNAALERFLPEQRLFLRTDTETRFIRLRPGVQALVLGGSALVIGWTIIATAVLLMDSIGSGNAREQARRELAIYETRIDALSRERDARAEEAAAAQERFSVALEQVSAMQSALLASEERRRELETGIGVIQTTLRRTMTERDEALSQVETLSASLNGNNGTGSDVDRAEDVAATLDFLTAALGRTAAERDAMEKVADSAIEEADRIALDKKLMEEEHDRIFTQLEDAVTVSMAPLDKMFTAAGLDPDKLLAQVRRGYSGQGGPLMPLSFSTKGNPTAVHSESASRAAAILDGLDKMNMYRIAVDKTPFAMPLKTPYRFTSGFGQRWGRMHAGVDLAGSHGSPVYSTADGVVTHADWLSGYGRLVKIKHEFGVETRYGHLSEIHVKVGQRVSRGDLIGDMGNTGRSTGTHLHYEVRVDGSAVNPMTYIKAGKNVF
ncbi:M23 family metallopeptidase [Ostreiculturibacter nitratireducens]|uniref:M23 family metallopeptidase n=1 Tax=Ostreiculturibacter nitratireducens TaxID=3075226 RepID=UPI0031B5C3A1